MTNSIDKQQPGASSVIEFTDYDSLEDQTASWVAKLDGDPDEATIAAFKRWINQSPEHRKQFERHMALWEDMNVLTDMVPPEPAAARSAKPWPAVMASIKQLAGWQQALATCTVVLVLFGLQFIGGDNGVYSTAIGEQKTVLLSDGTSVLLNTNSTLRVEYSDQRRVIYLSQGEAHFEVAHNPAVPFEVYAGKGKVRAVGTAFSVYLRSDDVEVVVTDGTVEILPKQSLPQQQAVDPPAAVAKGAPSSVGKPLQLADQQQPVSQVTAGNVATYDRHTAEHIMQSALGEADKKLSWHQGMLVFRSEPLENVIAEVNRYTPLKIIIPEQTVRHIKVGGFFKINDINSVFDALEKGFDIHANYISDELVYLVHREK